MGIYIKRNTINYLNLLNRDFIALSNVLLINMLSYQSEKLMITSPNEITGIGVEAEITGV